MESKECFFLFRGLLLNPKSFAFAAKFLEHEFSSQPFGRLGITILPQPSTMAYWTSLCINQFKVNVNVPLKMVRHVFRIIIHNHDGRPISTIATSFPLCNWFSAGELRMSFLEFL